MAATLKNMDYERAKSIIAVAHKRQHQTSAAAAACQRGGAPDSSFPRALFSGLFYKEDRDVSAAPRWRLRSSRVLTLQTSAAMFHQPNVDLCGGGAADASPRFWTASASSAGHGRCCHVATWQRRSRIRSQQKVRWLACSQFAFIFKLIIQLEKLASLAGTNGWCWQTFHPLHICCSAALDLTGNLLETETRVRCRRRGCQSASASSRWWDERKTNRRLSKSSRARTA